MVEKVQYGLKASHRHAPFCKNHRCEGYKISAKGVFKGRKRVKVMGREGIYLCDVCVNVLYI